MAVTVVVPPHRPESTFWAECPRCKALLRYHKADVVPAPDGLTGEGIVCPVDTGFIYHDAASIAHGKAIAQSTPSPGAWL